MPIYLDEIATDDSNSHLVNFAVFSDIPLAAPEHSITLKLRPIHIDFKDFEKLFFKKRRILYTVAKLSFLNELFHKIKPKLSRMLQDIYCVSNKASILLNKELFDMVLETRIRSRVSLTHDNFVKAVDSVNDTYVRITLSLGIVSISAAVNLEFIFKMRNIPPREIFNSDDLLNNVFDIFHGAINCNEDTTVDECDNTYHVGCDEDVVGCDEDVVGCDEDVVGCDVEEVVEQQTACEEEDIGDDCEE
jgi:hypothetical protein